MEYMFLYLFSISRGSVYVQRSDYQKDLDGYDDLFILRFVDMFWT